MKKIFTGILLIFISINLMASCGEREGYKVTLKKAISKHPAMKKVQYIITRL